MYVLVLLFLHGFLTDSCNGCTTGTFSFNNECRPCPENSSSCDFETACNSCKIGYHGETCSLACPQHCHDDECEKTSGTCFSCRKGYYGGENKTCIKCPESCATCRSNRYCFACKSGYKGDFCSNCKERTSCDKNTAYCLDSCRNGLSGELCNKKCDVKCKSCVRRNNNECNTCPLDKYGTNCNENCSKNECYDSDGVCTNGCSEGYWGTMCESLSSVNCNNSVCMIQNGTCLGGCIEDYYEHNCSKAHNSTHARHFGLVVGLAIGGALAIIIVAMCTCYFKRKHLSRRFKWLHALDECPFLCCRCFYKEQHNKDKHNDEMDVVSKTLHTSSEPTNDVNSLDKNENESLLPAGKLRIEKDGTPCNNPNERFQSSNGGKYKTNANDGRNARKPKDEEMEVVAKTLYASSEPTNVVNNVDKNETESLLPVGKLRIENDVRAEGIACNNSDDADEPKRIKGGLCFVNVASYKKSSKYIVSYGSKIAPNNESFWKKIWESRCEIVVMLSTSQELEEFNNSLTFGSDVYNITVRFAQGRDWIDYTMRPVTIEQDTMETIKETSVVLFEFFADIQDNVNSFLEFHKMVNGVIKEFNGPTLVHCSAGVHRCVTYIAVDMLKKNAKTIGKTDISLCLQHLNNQALQTTKEQIDYIYKILAQL